MTLKAFIFDVDGTLAETEELHRHSFNQTFEHFALGWHWDQDLYRRLLKTAGGKERIRAYASEIDLTIDDDLVVKMHRWKTLRYGEMLQSGQLQLREGVADLIDYGRSRKLKIGVATTTNIPNVEAITQACWGKPATHIFDTIAAGDVVQAKKPAPDIYMLALAQLGLPADDCVAMEDTQEGVRAAKETGIRVIMCRSHYSQDDDISQADYVVSSLTEAMDLPILKE